MFYFVFYRNNQPVIRQELRGDLITIGRDTTCDIQLIEEDISRVHASLSWENGSYIITDKSTNGTFVNDKRIKTHKLQPSDVIAISDWRIKFESEHESCQRKTVVRDTQPTKILKYEAKKKELTSEIVELVVSTLDSKNQKYSLAKAAIGASAGNDIVITNDPYISSNHCLITTEEDHFVLEDLGSKNGTFLNGKKITKQTLPKKGELTVGKTTIYFSIKQQTERLKPTAVTSLGPIIGKSEAMRELFSLASHIAPSDATVCLIGESGTGKELFARYIHEASLRHAKPFVAINCGAIPENLIESELFGHEKGAFTSATAQHRGMFEQAGGGTLFFDEIGEMPLDLQTRLLRVLETKHIRRVGGQSDIPIDVRVIAATNKDLKTLVRENCFREDLFYRLYVVPFEIPPLRRRKEDIEFLAEHFLNDLLPPQTIKHLSDGAITKLTSYDWPGNVRELRNTIQRALLVSKDTSIIKEDIVFSSPSIEIPEAAPLDEQKKNSVIDALKRANGNTSEAARKLGIARTTLSSMVKRFGIDIEKLKIKRDDDLDHA